MSYGVSVFNIYCANNGGRARCVLPAAALVLSSLGAPLPIHFFPLQCISDVVLNFLCLVFTAMQGGGGGRGTRSIALCFDHKD